MLPVHSNEASHRVASCTQGGRRVYLRGLFPEREVRCLYPDDFARCGNAQGTRSMLVVTSARRTESASTDIPASPTVPSVRQMRSDWDFEVEVSTGILLRRAQSIGIRQRTSYRGHAATSVDVEDAAFGIGQIASDLFHPRFFRMCGNADQRHSPCFQLDRKQNIVCLQTTPGEHLGCEEVDACQNRHLGSDEFSRRSSDCVSERMRCHGGAICFRPSDPRPYGRGLPEHGQYGRIPSPCSQLQNQRFQLGINPRTTRIGAIPGAIKLLRNQLPKPAEDSLRLCDLCYLCQTLPSQLFADRRERGALCVRKPKTGRT